VFVFKVYVAGHTDAARRVIANLKRQCRVLLQDNYELQVIDVLQTPEIAVRDFIALTPCVVLAAPGLRHCFIGDFSNSNRRLSGLCSSHLNLQKS
jgi:circadian clock protein KaiB